MSVLITDVSRAVRTGKTKAEIVAIINQYIADKHWSGTPPTAGEWAKAHYKELRRWAYPPMEEFVEAHIMIAAGLPGGQARLDDYIARFIAVRNLFTET